MKDRAKTWAICAALAPSVLLVLAPNAEGQDVLGIFGTGPEAKLHAGGGQLAADGPPSLYYDPANLAKVTSDYLLTCELDYVSFDYSYLYPGFAVTSVKRKSPLPYIGVATKLSPNWTLAASFLPFPGSTSKQQIDHLPSRSLGEDPIVVNANAEGAGFGYRYAVGVAYQLLRPKQNDFSLGASVVGSQSPKSTLTVSSAQGGEVLIVTESKSSSYQLIFGARAEVLDGRGSAVFDLHLPSVYSQSGNLKVPLLSDHALDQSGRRAGPTGVGFGGRYRIWRGLAIFGEGFYQNWASRKGDTKLSNLGDATTAYVNTFDYVAGADFDLGTGNILTAAAGVYPSNLADGVMNERAADGNEVTGMGFDRLDSMPYKVVSGGWRGQIPTGGTMTGNAGISYAFGDRNVAENARGYGVYSLRIWTVILGFSQAI